MYLGGGQGCDSFLVTPCPSQTDNFIHCPLRELSHAVDVSPKTKSRRVLPSLSTGKEITSAGLLPSESSRASCRRRENWPWVHRWHLLLSVADSK